MSHSVTLQNAIMIAATATLLALGCGGSLNRDDAGATGLGGASGTAGGRGGAGGGAGTGQVTDGGSDQSSCTVLCGRVESALRAGNCMYVLSCALVGNFTGLAVLVDGQAVPRDASRIEGWDYTDASMSGFEIFGQVCMDVLNNGASVEVAYLCELP